MSLMGLVWWFQGSMARGKQATIDMRESLDAPAPEKGIRDFYIFLVSSQSQPYPDQRYNPSSAQGSIWRHVRKPRPSQARFRVPHHLQCNMATGEGRPDIAERRVTWPSARGNFRAAVSLCGSATGYEKSRKSPSLGQAFVLACQRAGG
jgi:hypothetical protein